MKRRNDKGCKLLLLAVSDAVRAGDAHIKEEFNGHNHPELPRKYGVTERWVRSLCGPGQTEGQLCSSRLRALPCVLERGNVFAERADKTDCEIELPQAIVETFARFPVPEIRKYYGSEQGQREFAEWQEAQSKIE